MLRSMRRDAVLAVALVAAPLVFVWMLELAVPAAEIRDTTLIAYVWPVNALPVYHLAMYALFMTNAAAAYHLAARSTR